MASKCEWAWKCMCVWDALWWTGWNRPWIGYIFLSHAKCSWDWLQIHCNLDQDKVLTENEWMNQLLISSVTPSGCYWPSRHLRSLLQKKCKETQKNLFILHRMNRQTSKHTYDVTTTVLHCRDGALRVMSSILPKWALCAKDKTFKFWSAWKEM